jgi:SAM-dependent methyltransferase
LNHARRLFSLERLGHLVAEVPYRWYEKHDRVCSQELGVEASGRKVLEVVSEKFCRNHTSVVCHRTLRHAMTTADPRQFWDARFGEAGFAYGDQPNDFLREQAATLSPGRALCLAEGEGRNAVHLAQLDHDVLAQDLSSVGLAKAKQLAERRGVAIETVCGDLAVFEPQPQSFDLVVAIWMHLPPPLRAEVHRRAVAALRPGGLLILEAYTPRQLALGTGGPPRLELLIEPADVSRELAGLELPILRETRRFIAEGPWHRGESAVVQALARKP